MNETLLFAQYNKLVSSKMKKAASQISLAACGRNRGAEGGAKTEGKAYRIATDITFAPFEFEDEEGNFVGIDMEILAEIAKDQGFTYETDVLGFDAAVMVLEGGQADGVIAGMSITEKRMKKFGFSDPYFGSGVVMGVKGDSDIASYENIKDKNIAVKSDTEGETFANSIKEEYGFTTTVFDDSATIYLDVVAGNPAACL